MILRKSINCGCLAVILLIFSAHGLAQRVYAPSSVLATGNWYKLAVSSPGVYRIDLPFLNSLGVPTSGLPSTALRLFGNGGQMLPEANALSRADDLVENAILVNDGGDGQFNGNDYLLFYAPGPDEWVRDSVNRRFSHRKNIYSDQSYYFLTVGGTGKRISVQSPMMLPDVTVTQFSERAFHELDTVNFLSSGKEWYGEELSSLPGRSLSRNFYLPLPDALINSSFQVQLQCAARSVGANSRFDIRLNNQPAGQLALNAVGGGLYDLFGREAGLLVQAPVSGNTADLSFSFVPGSVTAQGWINWFEWFYRRNLSLGTQAQLLFRDWNSVGNNRAEYVITGAGPSTLVWDITHPQTPLQMTGTLSGTDLRFVNTCERLREYVAVNLSALSSLPKPVAVGPVGNQDLHNSSNADMLLITHASLLGEAQRLADWHRQRDGLRTTVVTAAQVYNEFSSGSPDPAAIRDFAKMYHDKYGNDPARRLRYLLLFGDASFDHKDRITGNSNLVPAWQHPISLDPLSTYVSDDFFGFLDDREDINSGLVTNLLDIGIGRVPASSPAQAKNFTDKVMAYQSPASLGPWRSQLAFVADDEDNNLHLQDAEIIGATAASMAPRLNQQKIYLDAFRQESGAGGSSYPQANQLNNSQLFNGTLIWNYNGHGGYQRLAEETLVDQSIINSWNNGSRLPLFVTATCDVAPYDNPTLRSIGEDILLRPQTGGIALMTTTRPVFAFSNRIMNNNYIRYALEQDAQGQYRSLGQALMEAKNFTYQTLGDVANNRKFTLLGDPALRLSFPAFQVSVTRVNGISSSQEDTLSALEKVTVEGEVRDWQGNLIPGFTGSVYPTVYDKPQTITTLANDPGSLVTSFQLQQSALFKGRATVSGGRFSFQFKVPRDINYRYGAGRMSIYAENGTTDAAGLFTGFQVGGAGTGTDNDKEGPSMKAWLNDRLFVNGGITNQSPVLLLQLEDSSGINTAATGIGHDITATLDNDNRQYYLLNDFYQAESDSYQRGLVRFPLPVLEPGPHSLRIKAWDVVNNSSELLLDFIVTGDEDLQISRVLNYPNPFTTRTTFWFEHNKPGLPLIAEVQIMTITGRVIRTLRENLTTEGNRAMSPVWDGLDDYGDRAGRGVYLYKLRVAQPGKPFREKLGKLVVL